MRTNENKNRHSSIAETSVFFTTTRNRIRLIKQEIQSSTGVCVVGARARKLFILT